MLAEELQKLNMAADEFITLRHGETRTVRCNQNTDGKPGEPFYKPKWMWADFKGLQFSLGISWEC